MRHPPATPIILATWITICATPARADHSAAVTCYAPDGKAASNDTIVPCNNLGITQSGVHSSCCQLLGDEDRRDLCTGTGLCLNNGIVRRGYCTDKTFDNPACVRVCETDDAGGNAEGFAEMTSCTDGTYCCGRNNLTCCGTPWAIEPPTVVSSTIISTVTADPSSSQTSSSSKAVAGLGGALGAVFLLAGGYIAYLLRQIAILQKAAGHNSDGKPSPLLGFKVLSTGGDLSRLMGRSPVTVTTDTSASVGTNTSGPAGTPRRLFSPPAASSPVTRPDVIFNNTGTGTESPRLATTPLIKTVWYGNPVLSQPQQGSPKPEVANLDYLHRASELDATGTAASASASAGGRMNSMSSMYSSQLSRQHSSATGDEGVGQQQQQQQHQHYQQQHFLGVGVFPTPPMGVAGGQQQHPQQQQRQVLWPGSPGVVQHHYRHLHHQHQHQHQQHQHPLQQHPYQR